MVGFNEIMCVCVCVCGVDLRGWGHTKTVMNFRTHESKKFLHFLTSGTSVTSFSY